MFAGKPDMPGNMDGTGSAAQLGNAHGLVYDGAGTLYVADSSSNLIRKITVPDGVITTHRR